jgi:riboflavin transporter FmnP
MGRAASLGEGFRLLALSGVLTGLAIVLHLFKVPFPPAPFLKFDLAGVPLAVLALYSVGSALTVQPVFMLGLLALGADVIGALMKVAAEASTFIPVALVYRKFRRMGSRRLLVLMTVTGVFSRVIVMVLLNLVITPYWLLLAKWASTYDEAWSITLHYLPAVAAFNAIAAGYVVPIAYSVFRVISQVSSAVEE